MTISPVTLLLSSCVTLFVVAASGPYSGKLLLVSMDGFRWDYFQKIPGLGNFSRLAKDGVYVQYVNATFVTKTFPNHYSIVTGLYQESHGIVANKMYDPVRNATFGKSSTESFWWQGGEPIWVTAVKQNKRAGVYFWVGSESEIRGHRPTKWQAYNQSVPFPERVQTAIGWFEEENMDYVSLYFHEPDSTGHRFGPDSPEVAAKVQEMDNILGLILRTLDAKNLRDVVNVIVTSDHGMVGIDLQNRLINLWSFVNRSMVARVVDSGSLTAIQPAEGQIDDVVQSLRKMEHVTVYRKEEVPDYFHYKNNLRVMPVLVLADEGWEVTTNIAAARLSNEKGDHGYSADLMSMKPIFFARGPNFRKGLNHTSIRSVDIYPLLCKLLGIEASPNNGSIANTARFLVASPMNSAEVTSAASAKYSIDHLYFSLVVLCLSKWTTNSELLL